MLRALLSLIIWTIPGLAFAGSSFTLPSTTTAYTANQLMANSATAGSVVVPSFSVSAQSPGFDVIIPRLQLFINDTTASSWNAQQITIDLWSAAPTFTNGDRGTYSPATGTASHLAAFTCTMSAVYGDGLYGECSINTGQALSIPAPGPTQIFWTATAKTGSGTTGASKTVTLNPEVAR